MLDRLRQITQLVHVLDTCVCNSERVCDTLPGCARS
jgi:hypothetical protein